MVYSHAEILPGVKENVPQLDTVIWVNFRSIMLRKNAMREYI